LLVSKFSRVLIAFRIPCAGLAEASGLISAGGLEVESILAAEVEPWISVDHFGEVPDTDL
jgi:hypothetical protein